ncbi:hypothetical protein PMI01_02192 [Caulobacter sp. AP07]|uniref:hypothetical protein n=1 Tax=Caulobacter sp. AP07 TaxID=1144304 RepID=UPI000272201F|nr:hypothetical protein [Caulobacter sp. AP07]EJL33230.1 hypothetical protein PMI01_02192 [Caulobacter sp. AP07]
MITFWGDSFWDGPPGNGYIPPILSGLIDADLRNTGKAGASTDATLEMMRSRPDLLPGIAFFSMGRCCYSVGPDKIADDYAAAFDLLGHDRLFVIPMTKTRRRGTSSFDLCEAIDDRLRDLAGDRFLDTQGHLIVNGLRLAGIAPTRRDERDIEGGIIPASLRCDAIHNNLIANGLVAHLIADRLVDLGWVARRSEAA